MNEELINKIITYNYNNFGNEFGDALVDLQQENKQLKEIIDKAIKYIDNNYQARTSFSKNVYDFKMKIREILK